MTDRFVVVPAAYIFLLREGGRGPEVLLQFRQNTGFMDQHWAAAAAGHVEKGETAFDAAHREAAEELGITGVDLAFEFSMQRTGSGEAIDERIDFFFTARSWVGEPTIIEPDKCAELRWCGLDALPDPVVPHERLALESLGTGAKYLTHGF
jgi:8-oxo-dGTP pyrophosphatase MutT (NUDIX family)